MKINAEVYHKCPHLPNPIKIVAKNFSSNETAVSFTDDEGYMYSFMTHSLEAVITWEYRDEDDT